MSVIKIALRMAAAAALAATISSAASAAVYPPQRQLPATVISEFKATPGTLLTQFPAGAQLISRVRDLGASDPTTVPALIALLKDPATTKDQIRAITAGLAQLARMAAASDQAFAAEIQAAIAGTNNPDVIAAYQAATGDVAIAAAGGGAGGGGSGAGGPTGAGGFANGGQGGTTSTFGGLHYANQVNGGAASGGVAGTTNAANRISTR
ncbi:hypothetical protein IVB25_23840 [Bradyrhizobium sp. 193]|uniref:hypothetical protein n=1 Tax=unclassified Bradyrhizobium TaxID=2631580 RepID=UPI00037AD001|nr:MULTISPECIES: hypothetical protein [unclassified Bradyrhizobium]MCK1345779.1 hypothetical protein [Bradyrhizobium sp. CW11]MCK1485639.1 hypothetical protein [Bradyrhizobium sp. 193]MCK1587121.1 hypothetical protein [Bradyrhizobium sp. 169]MCK1704940.1 hypothetical protein [Bradyrhizobium sp. 146]UPK10306.1 hypothetical protein IVA93_28955 [Bradyrhizobium sp. 155]